MSTLVERFIDELERVAGKAQRADSPKRVYELLLGLLQAHQARTVALSDFALARELNLMGALRESGYELVTGREIARADVGISGADLAVAETGSLLVGGDVGEWELVTALPPTHIALLQESQIVETLAQAFAHCEAELARGPKDFLFVTGPSRTADIELTPVLGVHGPQELIVFIVS